MPERKLTPEQVQEMTAQLRRDESVVETHRKNVEGLAWLFRQLYAKKSVEGELRERHGIRWFARKAFQLCSRSSDRSESALFDQAYVDRLKKTWGTVDYADILVQWCDQHMPIAVVTAKRKSTDSR